MFRTTVSLGLLFAVLTPIALEAQAGRQMGRTTRDVDSLSPVEAKEFLQNFLQARGGGDSIFEARLIHYPRRGEKVTIPARIYSRWIGTTLRLRIETYPEGESGEGDLFLFYGGPSPAGWIVQDHGDWVPLEGEDLFEPLLPGLDLTAFDLTTPYLDWQEGRYEESERVSDSPAHWFRFDPPEGWRDVLLKNGVASVRVALDARFEAPVRVEYLDANDGVVRSLEVRSFKKAGNTWYVRRLEGFDERSRDRTELRIDDAMVEIELDADLFRPASPAETQE